MPRTARWDTPLLLSGRSVAAERQGLVPSSDRLGTQHSRSYLSKPRVRSFKICSFGHDRIIGHYALKTTIHESLEPLLHTVSTGSEIPRNGRDRFSLRRQENHAGTSVKPGFGLLSSSNRLKIVPFPFESSGSMPIASARNCDYLYRNLWRDALSDLEVK